MTTIYSRVHTIEEAKTNNVDIIIQHLHEVGFLDKDRVEVEVNHFWGTTITNYSSGPKVFDYVTLKEPDDVMYYAYITEDTLKRPEAFCLIEVDYETDCNGKPGNNVVSLSNCGDAFRDLSGLIKELENLTGDKYTFTEVGY